MATSAPTFWDFVKEAFHRRPFVRGLGEVPWNKVALAAAVILGFGNPGFWLLGFGGELLYLYLTATNPRFRTLVMAKRLEAARASTESQLARRLSELGDDSRKRFYALRKQCAEVERISQAVQSGGLASLDEARLSSLDQLLWLFLRLLVSHEILARQLADSDAKQLRLEVSQLEQELGAASGESDRLHKSKSALLELKKKRVENLQRASEARQILQAELQRIEQQVELLREEAVISRSPEALSSKIDSVTNSLTDTNSWMRQHQDLLVELGADESAPPRILERARQAQ